MRSFIIYILYKIIFSWYSRIRMARYEGRFGELRIEMWPTFVNTAMKLSFLKTYCCSHVILVIAPNIVFEWLTLLRIRRVRVQISAPATGCPDWGFSWFSSTYRRMPGYCLKIRPLPLPTKSIPIHHHSRITLSSTLYILVAEKAW
jgi:hypothetical protein